MGHWGTCRDYMYWKGTDEEYDAWAEASYTAFTNALDKVNKVDKPKTRKNNQTKKIKRVLK